MSKELTLPFLDAWLLRRDANPASWKAKIDETINRYEDPHRVFHTVAHLDAMLKAARRFLGTPANPKTALPLQSVAGIEVATIYHDAVYIVGHNKRKPGDNERDSAKLAINHLKQLKAPPQMVKSVERMILNTYSHSAASWDKASQLLNDLDMFSLSTPKGHRDNMQRVRREYGMYDDEAFRNGRIAFLKSTLAKRKIFCTPEIHATAENSIRKLLAKELLQLESGNYPWLSP